MTQKLLVHFINRGYGTDEGHHSVEVLGFGVCEHTARPQAEIRSPFGLGWSGATLVAEYSTHAGVGGWICDLD